MAVCVGADEEPADGRPTQPHQHHQRRCQVLGYLLG